MIELSDDIKQICALFEKSENSVLMGLAHQIWLFKPDKKYTHANKKTFVDHSAWEMDRLKWQQCKKIITLEETLDTKVLKTFYEFPKSVAINDTTLILGRNENGSSNGWLRIKSGNNFKDYTFVVSKKGTVDKFKETVAENKKSKTQERQRV